jgi:Trk K+ transport system NAD-binding subunit
LWPLSLLDPKNPTALAVGVRQQLIGLLRREGISRAYTLALTQRAEIQQRTKHLQIHDYEEAEFVEITLVPTDNAVGKTVEKIAPSMPKDCVLVSIQRDGRVIIPRGDTVFQAGDLVTAFVRNQEAKVLFISLHGSEKI